MTDLASRRQGKSFDPLTLADVALSLRARANALIPLYDALSRDAVIPEAQWSGRAGNTYRRQHRVLLESVDELIEAYNQAASAVEEIAASPVPGAWDRAAPRIGRALERITTRTAKLERLAPRSLGKFSPEVRPTSVVLPVPEPRDDLPSDTLARVAALVPSRPAQKGVPRGMTRGQFRRIVSDAILAAPSLTAARMILWGSKNLGAAYDRKRRQDPNRFDCSSFVATGMRASGLDPAENGVLPDTTSMLGGGSGEHGYLSSLAVSDVRPGDLLFWGPPEYETGHVAIVLGNGFIMHAPRTGSVTSIAKMPDEPRAIAARRLRER